MLLAVNRIVPGDPLAVPVRVWNTLIANCGGFTGYTHQWLSEPYAKKYRHFLMASCDNLAQQREAASQGWSTYRIMKKDEKPVTPERLCSHQALGLQSNQSGACNGTANRQQIIAAPFREDGQSF